MSEQDELQQIKRILAQIRDQKSSAAQAPSLNAQDLQNYTNQLSLARGELANLEKGSAAYNRKLREVEKLTRLTRNALKDQRRETDSLTLATEGLTGAMGMFGNAMDTVVTKFAGLVKSVFDEAKNLDTVTVQFKAATGASNKLASNIGLLTDRLRLYGITSEKAAETNKTLMMGFTAFTGLNQVQQIEIGRTVALLGELGISQQESAKILDTTTRAMNMSLGESQTLLMDLRGTARALQVPVEQLTSDFAAAESRIVELGSRGPEAFKDISAAAKATGVGVSDLMGIVGQFDTFEGATKAAAGLNAVLQGSYFDPLSIMRAENPADQIELIRDAFFEAGVTVEDAVDGMDRFTKQSLASSLGTDVPNLMKLLTGDIEDLKGEIDEATYSFEEMSKEAFGLKGFDSIVNNTLKAIQRPVSQIQQATRATFEGFTPFIQKFQAYNDRLIDKTSAFVANNSQLVGAAGILYNLAGIDGVQQGYEIFKGIASFTGSVLSNLFSIKGVLGVMVAGALYMIKEDLGDIGKAFSKDGFMAGMTVLWDSLVLRFGELQDYLDKEFGLNKEFLMRGLGVMKQLGLTGFRYLQLHLFGPMYDYLELDLLPKIIPLFKSVASKIGTYFENMFIDVMNSMTKGLIDLLTGGRGSILLKGMGIDSSKLFGAGTPVDPEEGMSKEDIKKYRALKRNERFMKSQIALDDRTTEFMATRGAKIGQKEINDTIKTVTPYVAAAYDTAADLKKSAVDAMESTAKGTVKGLQEFYGTQAGAHQTLRGDLILDGKVLGEIITPISQKNFESNLSKTLN